MTDQDTRLNLSDLKAIQTRVDLEVVVLGDPPTLDSLRAEGHIENQWLNRVLDGISDAGRIATLLVAEMLQSGAPLIIASVFALLEYHRVLHGALALDQSLEMAQLIAFTVVCANVVHPIHALRELRKQPFRALHQRTIRGYLVTFWRRIWGKPMTQQVSWSYNPMLSIAAKVITWATIILAVYDLVAPLVTSILSGTAAKPGLILLIELLMGLSLSLAGVFFLQSAAHEIGVRTITDKPIRLTDVLTERQRQYDERVAAVRKRITDEHKAGKLADERRKAEGLSPLPNTVGEEPIPLSVNGTTTSSNGAH